MPRSARGLLGAPRHRSGWSARAWIATMVVLAAPVGAVFVARPASALRSGAHEQVTTPTATATPSPSPSLSPSPRPRPTPSPSPSPSPVKPPPRPASVPAYWEVASDGGIFSFGGTPFYGSMGGQHLNEPIVGLASPNGAGYWEVASDGGIFSFGNAPFHGSMGGRHLNRPIVGIAATPDGGGYWEVATDGGIFAFGDAGFFGSMGGSHLNQPIVAIAATPDGRGYWEVASDGGLFAFGDAGFFGSMGGSHLNQPIVSMVPEERGGGYVEIAADGGIFAYGNAPFYGSLGGIPIKRPIVAATATPTGAGYWFTDSGGEVFAFGQASYYGSAPGQLAQPVVGIAEGTGSGAFAGGAYPSGSYGYDISTFQCSAFPNGLHDIGIVQVDGVSSGATNPCLSQEETWAGAGLNLYTFLTNVPVANQGPISSPCSSTTQCYQVGYAAGIHAFQDAQATGLNTDVTWWLDVEGASSYWTGDQSLNAQTVQGAIDALRGTEGIATVGIYASPLNWNTIVGSYQPPVPLWMADWVTPNPDTPGGAAACADVANFEANEQLPTGPVLIVQYTNVAGATAAFSGYDGDYAC